MNDDDISGVPSRPDASALVEQIRSACAWVAARSRFVTVELEAIPAYASTLELGRPEATRVESVSGREKLEERAAFWLTLYSINFGSGWFPTLEKRPRRSGYFTVAMGVQERFREHGPWNAKELSALDPADLAANLGQDPSHELMGLYATSLNDLGRHIRDDFGGKFSGPADAAGPSAMAFVERLAGWECFADSSSYNGLEVPFLKRAQIAIGGGSSPPITSAIRNSTLALKP